MLLPDPKDLLVTEDDYRKSVAEDILAGKALETPSVVPGSVEGTTEISDADIATLYTDAKMYQLEKPKKEAFIRNYPTRWQQIKRYGVVAIISFVAGMVVGAGLVIYVDGN